MRKAYLLRQEDNGGHMALEVEARYPYIPAVRQNGAETFTLGAQTLPVDLLSFWQWSASDLLGNTMRGCLAEYIVAMALGITSGVRNDWEVYDLRFKGWKIEVKASGYLQTWPQKRLSRPEFSIRPARSWDPVTGRMSNEVRRQSDLYVFCLHHHKDKVTVNPRDLAQWTFYILPTGQLECSLRFKAAKSFSLNSLLTLKPSEISFNDLGKCITNVMSQVKIA
jgi:hypothetical protein